MGLEDYRVMLKSRPRKSLFPGEKGKQPDGSRSADSDRRTAESMAVELAKLGFSRLAATVQLGPAKLAAPILNEIRLTARLEIGESSSGSPDAEYIVEALIRARSSTKSAAALFDTLSMRFAVCQPEGAAWHFLKLVKEICEKLNLVIIDGDKIYSTEAFWAFRLSANEQIRDQEAMWGQIFDGDPERLPIGVEEAWGHFLKKRPDLTDVSEVTMHRRSAPVPVPAEKEMDEMEELDEMEETLAPRVKKSVPVPAEKAN